MKLSPPARVLVLVVVKVEVVVAVVLIVGSGSETVSGTAAGSVSRNGGHGSSSRNGEILRTVIVACVQTHAN